MPTLPGKLVAIALAVAGAAGCVYVPSGFAPSATPVAVSDIRVLGHARGKQQYFSLFGLIPFGKPDYDAAIRDAVGKVSGGRTLVNVRSHVTVLFVVVGYLHTLTVEGDVIS